MSVTSSPRSLRIGIDGRELQGRPTGVGRYLKSLLRRWRHQGQHKFVVYVTGAVPAEVGGDSVSVCESGGGHPLWWEQRVLPRLVANDGIDVLLSPAYSTPITAGLPRVTALHDLSFFARPQEFGFLHGTRRRVLAAQAAHVSSALLACSRFTRSEIAKYLGDAAASRTRVVLLGPDDDLKSPPDRTESRRALGIEDDTKYVIAVGTILERRRLDVAVRAVGSIARGGAKVCLGIIGEDRSNATDELRRLAHESGCDLRLTGFVTDDDVVRHYAAADVSLCLSSYEGFGLPALEGMSRGVPTIVANETSLGELFVDGALAVSVSEIAVTDAVRRLLSSREEADEARRRGHACAARFSWERTAVETLCVLETAAA